MDANYFNEDDLVCKLDGSNFMSSPVAQVMQYLSPTILAVRVMNESGTASVMEVNQEDICEAWALTR